MSAQYLYLLVKRVRFFFLICHIVGMNVFKTISRLLYCYGKSCIYWRKTLKSSCLMLYLCLLWYLNIWRGRGILLLGTIKIAYFSLLLPICLDQSPLSMTFHGCISFISECLGALKNHESRPFLDTTPIMQVSLFVFASSVQVVIYLLYAITGFWKSIAGYQKIIIYHELFILFSLDHFIGTHIFRIATLNNSSATCKKKRK